MSNSDDDFAMKRIINKAFKEIIKSGTVDNFKYFWDCHADLIDLNWNCSRMYFTLFSDILCKGGEYIEELIKRITESNSKIVLQPNPHGSDGSGALREGAFIKALFFTFDYVDLFETIIRIPKANITPIDLNALCIAVIPTNCLMAIARMGTPEILATFFNYLVDPRFRKRCGPRPIRMDALKAIPLHYQQHGTGVPQAFLVAGMKSSKKFFPAVCAKWARYHGKENKLVSLRLMIIRMILQWEVDVPETYPRALYTWPTYEQEMERAKRYLQIQSSPGHKRPRK